MGFLSAFVGAGPSKYSAISIVLSIIFVSLAMLIGKEPIPMGQKFVAVILMILFSLPAILLTLVQLTCMVTGAGMNNQRWWCSIYAWVMAAFIILYSVMLVVAAIMSMAGEKDAKAAEAFGASMNYADAMAREHFKATGGAGMVEKFADGTPEEKKAAAVAEAFAQEAKAKKHMEMFEDMPEMDGSASEPAAPLEGVEAEGFASCGAAYM